MSATGNSQYKGSVGVSCRAWFKVANTDLQRVRRAGSICATATADDVCSATAKAPLSKNEMLWPSDAESADGEWDTAGSRLASSANSSCMRSRQERRLSRNRARALPRCSRRACEYNSLKLGCGCCTL